jgi:hypothetical protein
VPDRGDRDRFSDLMQFFADRFKRVEDLLEKNRDEIQERHRENESNIESLRVKIDNHSREFARLSGELAGYMQLESRVRKLEYYKSWIAGGLAASTGLSVWALLQWLFGKR